LGAIELGGWNGLYTFWNPPPHLLEREIARFPEWLVWHALISPRLEILNFSAQKLANGLYRLQLIVNNSGWLPSYITQQGLKKKLCRGVLCELQLPNGSQLHTGERRQEIGQLEGRAYKNCSPTGWAAGVADPTTDRAKAEWVIAAAAGTIITVEAWHDRAGRAQQTVTLPA